MKRKSEELVRIEKMRESNERERDHSSCSWNDVDMEDLVGDETNVDLGVDEEYEPDLGTPTIKKKRRLVSTPKTEDDEMPKKWAHIRTSKRKVRPEF